MLSTTSTLVLSDLLSIKTSIELLIAILLALVAYQNYKINAANFRVQKDKLRLDLFNKRHNIFTSLQKLVTDAMRNGVPTRIALNEFNTQTSNAGFLFGRDIENYVKDLSEKSLRAIHLKERLSNGTVNNEEQRKEIASELYNIEMWFGEQYKNSRSLFRKYLHFSIKKKH